MLTHEEAVMITLNQHAKSLNSIKPVMHIAPASEQDIDAQTLFIHLTEDTELDHINRLIERFAHHQRVICVLETGTYRDVPGLINLPIHGITTFKHLKSNYRTIREAIDEGYFYMDFDLHTHVIDAMERLKQPAESIAWFILHPHNPLYELNQTEKYVLEGLANGYSPKEIAEEKGCSLSTIYLASMKIVRHFDAIDRTDAIVKAIRQNYLCPEYVVPPA